MIDYRSADGAGRAAIRCFDRCMAHLPANPRNQFLSAASSAFDPIVKPVAARAFQRAAGAACADAPTDRSSPQHHVEIRAKARPESAAGALLAELVSAGGCLVEADADIEDADALIIDGVLSDGVAGYRAGLNPFADTLRAEWMRSI